MLLTTLRAVQSSRCDVGLSSNWVVLVFLCPEDQVTLSSGCKVVGLSCWQIVWCWMNNSMKFIWDQTFSSEMLNRASICNFVSLFFLFVYFSFIFGILSVGFVTCALVSSCNMRFCLTSCSCLQNLTERKGLTVTSTSRHVNQSKSYNDCRLVC